MISLTTAVIVFREFLEAFLIVGVFFGISKKLHLKKETEIGIAALIGVIISVFLASVTYFFGDHARNILTEKNADFLQSYLLIFSGFFIAYVVFSLHGVVNRSRGPKLIQAHKKLQENVFDLSLFFTIVFLVVREGFEIALFTASVSLFSGFLQNIAGLLLGFFLAGLVGASTFFAYIRFPFEKAFKVTEYMIILLGASLLQNGVTKLFETHFNINLSNMVSFHFSFLPGEDTLVGHVLQGLFGLDRGFSLIRLAIMALYIAVIYSIYKSRYLFPAGLLGKIVRR